MEYDLIRLFEHPLYLLELIPPAIVTLAPAGASGAAVRVEYRASAAAEPTTLDLEVVWDADALRPHLPHLDAQLRSLRERDFDRATRVEMAAIAVAVGVLGVVEPQTRFTGRAEGGDVHDYFLNDTDDEMIEVSGRWEGGLPGLFDDKRAQSDRNPRLRRRWVSVTIFHVTPRNRTEGLHP